MHVILGSIILDYATIPWKVVVVESQTSKTPFCSHFTHIYIPILDASLPSTQPNTDNQVRGLCDACCT